MITVGHSFELKVKCDKCGNELTATFDDNFGYDSLSPELEVEPCDNCLDKKTKESYAEGYADGEYTAMSKFEQLN